jgi:hypothetical protein
MHGARLSQCETWRKAQPLGRIIDCDENLGIAALASDDKCSLTSPRIAQRRRIFMQPGDAIG